MCGKSIVMIEPTTFGDTDEGRRIRELETRGIVRSGAGRIPRGFWDAPRLSDPLATTRRALIEERERSR
jgi:hypothetical protein